MTTEAAPQPVEEPAAQAGEVYSPERGVEKLPMKRCAKCGKWKYYDTDPKKSEYPYWTKSQTWASWCKSCYGQAASVGNRARKARKAGDQAGALMAGEGELQRTVRRGDKLMSVAAWAEYGVGALVLLSGEAVYQLETRDDGVYVRILRRYPLNPLPPIPLESFVFLRGKEEGVYYI